MYDLEGEECSVTVGAKMPPSVAAKLSRLARESRRSKSMVLRLLVERASVADLMPRRYAGSADDGSDAE